MSEAIAHHTGAKCPLCLGTIYKGQMIELFKDSWAHQLCVPSPGPWNPESVLRTPTMRLAKLLTNRDNIATLMLEADFDPEQLPEGVAQKLWEAVSAEESLLSLLDGLASEHVHDRERVE